MNDKPVPTDSVTTIPANLIDTKAIEVDVVSYAGHVAVDKKEEDWMFYWFFESRKARLEKEEPAPNPEEIPLVIWLNGGPGSSSLIGLFMENGPYLLTNNDTGTIVENPNAWNEKVHLLYWDQPLGTGYSYSQSDPKHFVEDEPELSELFIKALQGFLHLHPEYAACPIYLTGESYAGKYVPNIATAIMDYEGEGLKPNLVGLAIGDGWIKPEQHLRDQIDFGFEMGFLDTRQRGIIEAEHKTFRDALHQAEPDWSEVVRLGNKVMSDVLACGGNPDIYDVRRWTGLSTDLLGIYLNRTSVKKALHVPDDIKWETSDDEGDVAKALVADNMIDSSGLLKDLVNHGYRMLFYDGNFDMACGYTGTEKILQDLEWRAQIDWKKLDRSVWVDPPNRTLGYYKACKNLTQVLIVDAGHLVPMNEPLPSRMMLYNWIFKRPFSRRLPQLKDSGT